MYMPLECPGWQRFVGYVREPLRLLKILAVAHLSPGPYDPKSRTDTVFGIFLPKPEADVTPIFEHRGNVWETCIKRAYR